MAALGDGHAYTIAAFAFDFQQIADVEAVKKIHCYSPQRDGAAYLSKNVGNAQYMISSTDLVLWPPEHWV